MHKHVSLFSSIFFVFALFSCSAGADRKCASDGIAGDTVTSAAELLTIIDHGDYSEVLIRDPWQSGDKMLAHFALVPRESGEPAGAAKDGCKVLRVPVERSAVFSSVHTAPMFEIGAGNALTAVADGEYFAPADTVGVLLSAGLVADVGSSASPSAERLLALETEAVLLSPMQNSGSNIFERSGVAAVPMVDYMERTPLARAEWIKLLGAIYGHREEADLIYDKVCREYRELCDAAATADERPKVLTENLVSGVWYVPAGHSYMARMLADAGAGYPWASDSGDGSLALDASAVLDRAADADIWLMRCYGNIPSYPALKSENPAAAHIKAFKNRNIYVCDSSVKNIFNDIAFHPERVLRDYVIIFHPGLLPQAQPRYFEKL